ncbi:hypothetical protein OKW40_000208 [Paraburkholderia sp. RAU6.4a]
MSEATTCLTRAGGFAAELAHPLQCSLIQSSGVQLKRRSR